MMVPDMIISWFGTTYPTTNHEVYKLVYIINNRNTNNISIKIKFTDKITNIIFSPPYFLLFDADMCWAIHSNFVD